MAKQIFAFFFLLIFAFFVPATASARPNPLSLDTDRDGLSDELEGLVLGTNPRSLDTDCDGVSDAEEFIAGTDAAGFGGDYTSAEESAENFKAWATSLKKTSHNKCGQEGPKVVAGPPVRRVDTDGDGLPDELEQVLGTNPLSPDTDCDGLSDAEEQAWKARGADPLVPTKGMDIWFVEDGPDTDRDGLPEGQEKDLGTNPLRADTDRDGVNDGDEVAAGTNPRHK